MAKTPLLFVDTNIFLDFYRAGGEAGLTLLEHIETVSDRLIVTDQIEMEFLNNRQSVILSALKLIAPAIPPIVPAYLSDSQNAAGIEKNIRQIKKRVDSMKQRFARLLKDPNNNDPVFKALRRAVARTTSLNLKFANSEQKTETYNLALQRYQRGFPPRKRQDNSIGDSINWEWIVACAKTHSRDVLIVSRDGDFGLSFDKVYYLNDWLAQEFKERVSQKKKVELSMSLAQALKKLEVKVTAAEEKEEQNIIKQIPVRKPVVVLPVRKPIVDLSDYLTDAPSFWEEFKNRVRKISPFTHALLNDPASVTFSNNTLVITLQGGEADCSILVNNPRNRLLFQTILKDLGLGEEAEIIVNSVASPATTSEADDQFNPSREDVPS